MSTISKPILYSGFKIDENTSVKNRIDRAFFTEVYSLSNGASLYLFMSLKPNQIVGRSKNYNLVRVTVGNSEYLALVVKEHSQDYLAKVLNDITTPRGFDCVAGMRELKDLLLRDVVDPLVNPEKFIKFKLSIPNGILLFGPPGCGKTFIVRKLAEELGYNFMEIKHSDVASPYIHGGVGKIAKVFEMAKLKAPSVVFIDEIEGLVPMRENLDSAQYKQEEINEFLMHLNGAGEAKVLVVGATNRPHLIDVAILRSGRMDKRIYVPPPDLEARKELMKMCLSGRPCSDDIDFEELANATHGFVSSDIELIITETARLAVKDDKSKIDHQMIFSIIKKFNPSISDTELEYYQQFMNLERQ